VETSTGQKISTLQKSRIEQQIDSVFHCSIKSAEQLDYDQLSKGVDDRYKAGFISNGTYYAKYDSLIDLMKVRSQGIAKQSITIKQSKITVLSEKIVLLAATGNTNIEVSDGSTFSVKFFWTFVYEKSGNEWKVIQSHQSGIR
jgi:hypothetical protein